MERILHRGRVQAQGDDLEKSVSWAQRFPPSVAQGHQMLDELRSRLSPWEQRLRALAFDLAHRFVDQAAAAGGAWSRISKSFPPNLRRDAPRVDIEVILGVAFVPDDRPSTSQ
jgi:hypothetical protein